MAKKVYAYYLAMIRDSGNNQKLFEKQLAEVRDDIDNIVNAVTKGMFHESMIEKMDALEARKDEVIKKIAEESAKQYIEHDLDDIKDFLLQGQGICNKTFYRTKDTYKHVHHQDRCT